MHYLREPVHGLRAGASQRAIAHDLGLARMTVQKHAQLAAAAGYLDAMQPLPDASELAARLGPPSQPPCTRSTVKPYCEQVEQLLEDGVEMMTIFDRITRLGRDQMDAGIDGVSELVLGHIDTDARIDTLRRALERSEALRDETAAAMCSCWWMHHRRVTCHWILYATAPACVGTGRLRPWYSICCCPTAR